jgi:lipopolysaccharide export system protein LptC
MIETLRRSIDRLALYLPAILMALFALGSWWLVRSLPSFMHETPPQSVRHEPDYYLEQFSVKSFDKQGLLIREISGHRAKHFPDTDTLEISNVTLRGQKTQSTETKQKQDVFTANSMQLNSKNGVYELNGQVRGMIYPGKP